MSARRAAASTVILVLCLVGLAVLAAVLLAASLLPPSTVVGRFMGATGDVRAGTVTQTLVANLPSRMRLAGFGFAVLLVLLVVLRRPFASVLETALADARARWRQGVSLDRADWAVVFLMAIAVAARVVFLNQPMRYDEALSFNEFASRAIYYGLSFYPEPNNHLLNTLLMHIAYAIGGNQPWVLRLPALVAGVLLVPATYALGVLLYGRAVGLLAAGLVAASSYLVEYSTNARGYTIAALCCTTMFALAIVAVRRDSVSALLLAGLVAALGIYAVPTTIYGVAIAAVWLAIEMRRTRPRQLTTAGGVVMVLLMTLLVMLAYLPVVLVSGPEALVSNRFLVPLDWGELVQQLPTSLRRTWALWNRDLPLIATLLLGVGCVVASVDEVRRGEPPIAVVAIAVCLGLVLLQRVAPFERVWLVLLPLYFVVGAGGLAVLVSRWTRVPLAGQFIGASAVAVGLAALTVNSGSVLASPETGAFPDAEAVSITLRDRGLGQRDAVQTELPSSLPELQYYFPRAGLSIDRLVRDPSGAERVWVIAAPDTQPPSGAEEVARYRTAVVYLRPAHPSQP